jgi:Holliday junction resolvase
MSRFARRVDDNHKDIVDALRKIGAKVKSTAAVGSGFPDLVVGYKGDLYLLEIKDGSKSPSKRVLTKDEEAFMLEWSGISHIGVVSSIEEAISFLNGDLKGIEK